MLLHALSGEKKPLIFCSKLSELNPSKSPPSCKLPSKFTAFLE